MLPLIALHSFHNDCFLDGSDNKTGALFTYDWNTPGITAGEPNFGKYDDKYDHYAPLEAARPKQESLITATVEEPSSKWSTLDTLQVTLDVAGFLPVVGIFADVANAGVSAIRGDFVGAGINIIAAVPIAGDALKGGKMLTKGASTVAGVAGAGSKAAGNAAGAGTTLAKGTQAAGNGATATAKGTNGIKDAADDLSKVVGKNRITIQTPSREMNYDLAGKPHFDKKTGKTIDTPHVQERVFSRGPNGKINVDESKSITRPLTFQDIRIIKRFLKLE